MRQKHVAIINDVTGYSRCSVAASLPILSVMKIQCSFIPTAILSANTNVPGFVMKDFTENMSPFIQHWKNLNLQFDSIGTGYLGSPDQAKIVIDFIKHFKKQNTLIFVDPVMGDNGVLYPAITKELVESMKTLVTHAQVITPNLTEACALLDIHYGDFIINYDNLKNLCDKLTSLGPQQIVISGIPMGTQILNFVYDHQKITTLSVDKIGESRTGCGDVFASIILGSLTNHLSFQDSVQKAVCFCKKAIQFTTDQGLPINRGLCFEEYLYELGE